MSSISGISGAATGIQPIQFPSLDGTDPTSATGATGGASKSFGSALTGALDGLQKTQATSDDLATQMATGQLTDVQDYMIAANKSEIATQLTVAVRDKAVSAFNQIMNMQM